MPMRSFWYGILTAAIVALGAPCSAQTFVKPGDTVTEKLDQALNTSLGTTVFIGCYTVDPELPPGTSWRVAVKNSTAPIYFWLSHEDRCEEYEEKLKSGGQFDTTEYISRRSPIGEDSLTFRSGGGSYQLITIAYEPSTQTVSLTPTPSGGKQMPRGIKLGFRPPVGTASTAGPPTPGDARAGTTIQDCPECPALTVIPAGSYLMGSPSDEEGRSNNEGPRRSVKIGRAFAIGTYEVTFDEYLACVAAEACSQPDDNAWGKGRRPVIKVTFDDAQKYAGWLSNKTGKRYFLPSEAEWEYAARAGTTSPWNTGDALIGDDANILGQFQRTVPVGSFPPSPFGLFDMHGNVFEWVQDCLDVGYFGAGTDGAVASGGDCRLQRVVRGGSFESDPVAARSARRAGYPSNARFLNVGFRVTRALD